MPKNSQLQTKNSTPKPTISLSQPGILQRQCDCGGTPGLTGECKECSSKRLSGQRQMNNVATLAESLLTPSTVQRSPVRSSHEMHDSSSFQVGYDFSQVQVHQDARASELTQSANEPFVGISQIKSFGLPVISRTTLQVQRQQGGMSPPASSTTPNTISGSPYATTLPGYAQAGDTCGAASLVTALIIWDREHWDAAQPNSRVVTACNLILTRLSRYGNSAISRWTDHPAPQVRHQCNSDRVCIQQQYTDLRWDLTNQLQRIRDAGRQPGANISQSDYRILGQTLYFLWHEGGRAGLSANEIHQIADTIGLADTAPNASSNIQSFDEIFGHSIVTGLQPDQFAQVTWFVNTGQQHAFLLGRLQSGEWFLSDQGPSPAAEFRSPTLANLRTVVRLAAVSGQYWLFVGTSTDYISRFGILPSWTGVSRLASHTNVETQAQNLIPPNADLGEVDAGWTTIGNRITRAAFVTRRYSLTDAQAQFGASTSGGGLIVEMPQGVFNLYTTSAVSDANLSETSLDAADSGGAMLMHRTFFHAWLMLGTASGRHGGWFSVY